MTDTYHNIPSDGSMIARGVSTLSNGGTVNTGLPSVSGFIGKAQNSDTVVAMTSASGPNATISLVAAGTPVVGNRTIMWEAWSAKKV